MEIYFSWFKFPSMTTIGPILSQQKQAHTMREPPPCLTVGDMQSGWLLSEVVLLTRRSRDPCQSSMRHSSDQITRFQSFNVQPMRALLYHNRILAFFLEMNGLRIAFLDRSPRYLSLIPMVSYGHSYPIPERLR